MDRPSPPVLTTSHTLGHPRQLRNEGSEQHIWLPAANLPRAARRLPPCADDVAARKNSTVETERRNSAAAEARLADRAKPAPSLCHEALLVSERVPAGMAWA